MSRVGKSPIAIPDGTTVSITKEQIAIKGKLGSLTCPLSEYIKVKEEDNKLHVELIGNTREARAMWGTTRALLNNMVEGVSKGFERRLTLVGVGFRAQAQGNTLNMSLGFSHPIAYQMPEGVKCETPSQTEIVLKGIDKQVVGQAAAKVRAFRGPEPYKGKGVRYADEVVKLKETKKK